ncbi:MAG TPA: EAL domain-containing protein [Candidatus Dormibacteraeota bacterium]|nr:EAL domain-containing protein [Candidatus Dormibacteraeota bacterium]
MDDTSAVHRLGRPLRVLAVTRSRRAAHRVELLLRRGAPGAWEVTHVEPAAVAAAATAGARCVILDLGGLDEDVDHLLTRVGAAVPRAPVVVLASGGDEARGRLALNAGAIAHVGAEWKRPGVLRRAVDGVLARQRSELERYAAQALVAEMWSRTRAILDSLDLMAVAVDQQGTIVAANAGWLHAAVSNAGPFSGATPGTSYVALHDAAGAADDDGAPVGVADGVRAVLAGRWMRFDVDCRFPGSDRWLAVSVRPLRGIGAVIAHTDVTDRKARELQVAANALQDPLTGLPNREVVLDRLRHATAGGRRRAEATGVLFVDLDEFKAVNDTHGHEAGDIVLRTVADRLRAAVRPGDTVARLGGDEFVVLCHGVADATEASELARRLLDVIAAPVDLHGSSVVVHASIGGTMARRGSAVAEDLVGEADAAMYRAKQLGRARLEFAADRRPGRRRPRPRRGLDEELRHGLEAGEISLAYQPIVALSTGRIMAAEALLRWRRADGVVIEPGAFVPAVEETGAIAPLGRWVLTTACAEMATLARPRRRVPPLGISINLSGRELTSATLVEDVTHALSTTGWRAADLCLEITETALMVDPEAAARNLDAIRGLGVRVALDDFGTGYSTLLYAKHFKVDIIKIDRAFVEGVGGDGADTVIVQSVLALAHSLGAHVIAEGVETAAHVAALRALGCESAQGFYFARPLAFESFEQLCTVEHRLWEATHARLVGAAG